MSSVHIDSYLDLDAKNPVKVFYFVGTYVGTSFHAFSRSSSFEDAYDSLVTHCKMFPDRTYSLVTVHCLIQKSNPYDSRTV